MGILPRRSVSALNAAVNARSLREPAPGSIPVPEVLNIPFDDEPRREPPPSTWFDDLDSGRVPLESGRVPLESEQRQAQRPQPNKPDPWSGSGRR